MPNFWLHIKATHLNFPHLDRDGFVPVLRLSGVCVGSGEAVSLRHSSPGAANVAACDSSCSQTSVSEGGAPHRGSIAPKSTENGIAALSRGTAGQI